MRYRDFLLSLLGALAVECTVGQEVAPDASEVLFPEATFSVAYVLRSPDVSDASVDYSAPTVEENDPFATEGGFPPGGMPSGGILHEQDIVDIVLLAGRVLDRATLDREQALVVTKAVVESEIQFPILECYDPHHAVVFYSKENKPVGCLEICFKCNTVKAVPRPAAMPWGKFYEPVDLFALAELFDGVGLSLAPYKSLESLKASKEEQVKPVAEPKKGEQPAGGNGGQAR